MQIREWRWLYNLVNITKKIKAIKTHGVIHLLKSGFYHIQITSHFLKFKGKERNHRGANADGESKKDRRMGTGKDGRFASVEEDILKTMWLSPGVF